nr:hypothetical protein Iba_chr06bCG13600 [Ipomoea batatas]
MSSTPMLPASIHAPPTGNHDHHENAGKITQTRTSSLNEQALLTSLPKKILSRDSLLTEAEAFSASAQSRSFTSVQGRGDARVSPRLRAEVVTPTSAQGRGDARVSLRLRAEVVTPTLAQGRGDARVSPRL